MIYPNNDLHLTAAERSKLPNHGFDPEIFGTVVGGGDNVALPTLNNNQKNNKPMSTVTTQAPQLPAPIVGKFNLALTESKFQQLADEAATLIFNEDNLEKIKDFLDRTRKVEKAIEVTHKAGKEEALTIGRQWDAGKNAFLATVAGIKENPQAEYTRICQEVEKRRIAQQQEKARIESIKNGIESNAILFAKQIADCETSQQLTAIESKINLEKTRKEKYQEFLPEAATRFTALRY